MEFILEREEHLLIFVSLTPMPSPIRTKAPWVFCTQQRLRKRQNVQTRVRKDICLSLLLSCLLMGCWFQNLQVSFGEQEKHYLPSGRNPKVKLWTGWSAGCLLPCSVLPVCASETQGPSGGVFAQTMISYPWEIFTDVLQCNSAFVSHNGHCYPGAYQNDWCSWKKGIDVHETVMKKHEKKGNKNWMN